MRGLRYEKLQRRFEAARGLTRMARPADPVSGELIRPGVVVLSNGIAYYSPGAVWRAALELQAEGPGPTDRGDFVAAILGRLTKERLDAEDAQRRAAEAVRA
jgi:hypothetical protein